MNFVLLDSDETTRLIFWYRGKGHAAQNQENEKLKSPFFDKNECILKF